MSVFELFEITSVFMFVTQDQLHNPISNRETYKSIQLTWPKCVFWMNLSLCNPEMMFILCAVSEGSKVYLEKRIINIQNHF